MIVQMIMIITIQIHIMIFKRILMTTIRSHMMTLEMATMSIIQIKFTGFQVIMVLMRLITIMPAAVDITPILVGMMNPTEFYKTN